jgi:hypothetical protein
MVFPGYPQITQGLVNYYYVYVYINSKNLNPIRVNAKAAG